MRRVRKLSLSLYLSLSPSLPPSLYEAVAARKMNLKISLRARTPPAPASSFYFWSGLMRLGIVEADAEEVGRSRSENLPNGNRLHLFISLYLKLHYVMHLLNIFKCIYNIPPRFMNSSCIHSVRPNRQFPHRLQNERFRESATAHSAQEMSPSRSKILI